MSSDPLLTERVAEGNEKEYTAGMKNPLLTIFIFTALLFVPSGTDACMTSGGFFSSATDWNQVVEHTLSEEQEGKELWSKLQAKEIACADLNEEQYGVLGEYFMGQVAGDSHPAMNAMMIRAHGEDGEEQIHIALGKRLSGCDTAATAPAGASGWMPMMRGGWSSPFGINQTNTSMMNFGQGYGTFGWLPMLLWWVVIIIAAVALVKWLMHQQGGTAGKSALDILKERYAKGEIDKQEFEEKKKDLS